MTVNHRCLDAGVPEQLLERSDIRPSLQQMGRKRMTQRKHTTHKLGPGRIAYRFHPFYDREVTVIRRLRAQETPCVTVQIGDDLRIAIPCWMLDPTVCDAMATENVPSIAIEALQDLCDFIDVQAANVAGTTPHEKQENTPAGSEADPPSADL